MNFPNDLMYTKHHEWIKMQEAGTALVGLSDYAQDALGDLVFVNLPEAGDEVAAGEPFADVESVKAVSDVYSAGYRLQGAGHCRGGGRERPPGCGGGYQAAVL